MSSEILESWRKRKIKDIARVVGGSTPDTKDPTNYGGTIPWITPKDLSYHNGRYIFRGERNITEKGLKAIGNRLIPKGSLLISSRAPIGYLALAGTDLITNQGIRSLVFKPDCECVPKFVYYLIKNNIKIFENFASGSTFQEITGSTIGELEFIFPPLLEQRKIAEILGSLDDKIELNYRMNKTLEAIAQAIFKNWFVDFEPFKDGLVYNKELNKEIPKGWEIVELKEILSLEYGKGLPKRERKAGNVPVYGSNGIIGWHNKPAVKGPGIIVGRKGTAGSVIWSYTDFFPIDTTFYVVPRGTIKSMVYLYFELLHQNLPKLVADSAVPGLNRNIVYLNMTVLPPENLIKRFNNLVMPLFEMMHWNTQEANTLEQIRDALLPKLLSGKIRVKVDIENEFPEETEKLEEIKEKKVKLQESLEKWFK